MRVLIAGAGIAGLTTALALHAVGIEAQVVDSATELKPLGVGINCCPFRTPTRPTPPPPSPSAWPQYSIHRGELQMILLAAVRGRLGLEAVKTGTTVTGFTERDGFVEVQLSIRQNGLVVPARADLLIGADGLYSAVRAQLHPGEPPPRWSGVMMWRGVTPGTPFLSGATLAVAGSTTSRKFVAYPIARRDDGTVLINWVAEAMIGGDAPPVRPDWTREGRLAEALPYFRDWTFDWLDIAGLMTRTTEILEYPMVDRDPLPFWGRGRVTLTGDAAHPMYPVGSNGGSQAIIDASVLARSLADEGAVAKGPGRLRGGQAASGQQDRAGQPLYARRRGAGHGCRPRPGRLRPDRGRARRRRARDAARRLPGHLAGGRGRAQLPPANSPGSTANPTNVSNLTRDGAV